MPTQRGGEGEGVKGRSRPAGARSAALEALGLAPASCESRAPARLSSSQGCPRRLEPPRAELRQIDWTLVVMSGTAERDVATNLSVADRAVELICDHGPLIP